MWYCRAANCEIHPRSVVDRSVPVPIIPSSSPTKPLHLMATGAERGSGGIVRAHHALRSASSQQAECDCGLCPHGHEGIALLCREYNGIIWNDVGSWVWCTHGLLDDWDGENGMLLVG